MRYSIESFMHGNKVSWVVVDNKVSRDVGNPTDNFYIAKAKADALNAAPTQLTIPRFTPSKPPLRTTYR